MRPSAFVDWQCKSEYRQITHLFPQQVRGERSTKGWEKERLMGEKERWVERREMEGKGETDRERDETGVGGRWMDRLKKCVVLAWLTAMPHSQFPRFLFLLYSCTTHPPYTSVSLEEGQTTGLVTEEKLTLHSTQMAADRLQLQCPFMPTWISQLMETKTEITMESVFIGFLRCEPSIYKDT